MPAERRGARAPNHAASQLTAVDLFAGAGGASQGLVDAGFRLLAGVENDSEAADTYAANHPDARLYRDDIRIVDIGEMRATLGLARGELTILNACPPCQGFSTLGSADARDPRNELIEAVWPFVSEFRPRALVLENVPGIRSDARLTRLLRQVRAVGYTARPYAVEASDYGAPQRRRRHLVVAVRDPAVSVPDDLITLVKDLVPTRPVTVKTVFDRTAQIQMGSDPHHVARTLRTKTKERVSLIPVGGSRFDLPKSKQLTCHKKLKQRHATGAYGRMRADEPAPTLTTRCTTVSCGSFIHPSEDRGITLREAALIQTFPETYSFAGGYDSIERQIGNALPPKLAEMVARAVLALL